MKTSNFKIQTPIKPQNKKYLNNLKERTAIFAENVILLLKQIIPNSINKRLIEQLSASAGSMGANYCEANESESKIDFIHKIGICKKETKETMHWIRLLAIANPHFKNKFKLLWQEARELLLIFSTIKRNTLNHKI